MKLGLINSAWVQTGWDVAEGIRKTRELGFDTIDIFADPLDLSVQEKRRILETTQHLGLPVISVACVALGLIDFNPSVRRFHRERCRKYLELIYEFRAQNLLLVLGEYLWQQEVIAPREQWQYAVEALRALGEYASALDLKIAVELEPFRLSLVNSVPTMRQLLTQVNLPRTVRANCDISHLYLVHAPPEEVMKLAGWIEHVHLSDCDGVKHGDLPPGRGSTPITDYLLVIHQAGYNGTVSVELEYCPEPAQVESWVKEAYERTAQIMRQLNLRG